MSFPGIVTIVCAVRVHVHVAPRSGYPQCHEAGLYGRNLHKVV